MAFAPACVETQERAPAKNPTATTTNDNARARAQYFRAQVPAKQVDPESPLTYFCNYVYDNTRGDGTRLRSVSCFLNQKTFHG